MISVIIPSRNAAARTSATVRGFLEAADATATPVEIVVVDDCSRPGEAYAPGAHSDRRIRLVANKVNLGRGCAVNTGAHCAKGRWLLIVDCDCPPTSTDFFASHLLALREGADVSIGALYGGGSDFWRRYQDMASSRRVRKFKQGAPYALTTQNIMIDAEWFRRIGGFDAAYVRYGFEDRDFIIRLAEAGARITYAADAGVRHDDDSTHLASIASKMRDAGEFTASKFRRDHPDAYRHIGYAALDASVHPTLRPLGKIFGRIACNTAARLDPWLDRLPFAVGRWLATTVSGLAFLYGTTRADTFLDAEDPTTDSPLRRGSEHR